MQADYHDFFENLSRRGYKPYLARDAADCAAYIARQLPAGAVLGFGGSMTVDGLKLPLLLRDKGLKCNHVQTTDIPYTQLTVLNRTSEFYITGANAVTEDGIFVNMDGRGNRLANICYGPKICFTVFGSNKIVKDTDAAVRRIETVAAPKNCVRLNKNAPCAKTGTCQHCFSPDKICKQLLFSLHPSSGMDVHTVMLDMPLGY